MGVQTASLKGVLIADLGLKPKNPTNSKEKKKNKIVENIHQGIEPAPLYPKLAG
jgi:hypothetical protein